MINIYRPPSAPIQLFEETITRCQEIIEEVMEKEVIKSKTLLAMGDFVFPFIQWPSKQIYSREEEPAQMSSEKMQGRMLLNWAEENFMEQYVNTATRKGNILDLIFSNSDSLVNGYTTIVNSTFSDHNILKICLNYQYKDQTKVERTNPYPNSIYEYDLMKASEEDWIRYNDLLSKLSEDFDEKTKGENTEERLSRFYKLVEKTVVTLFEKKEAFKTEEEKELKKGNKIPKTIRILMRKKTIMSKKILKSNLAAKTLTYMHELNKIEKELETSYNKMKLMKEKEALSRIKRNPKYFYKYANKHSKTPNRVGPLVNETGQSVKDPYLMAEILRKQYESTFSKPHENYKIENLGNLFGNSEEVEAQPEAEEDELEEETNEKQAKDNMTEDETTKESPRPPPMYDAPFDHMDIVDAIDQLAECSGPGPDGISAILLKKAKLTVALMMYNIFQHSMEKSDIPAILKVGFICPILKPNSERAKASSWRPVSLTSHVMKTMERVVRKQIVNHLESNNLMNKNQHGSRKRKSCLSQLLEHYDEILKILEEGDNVDVVYTDFEKAYEKVNHFKLMEKMKNKYNITGKLGKWLQNFFINRTQKVLIEERKSKETKVISGAVQGSVFGPIFFLMFIGDITEEV